MSITFFIEDAAEELNFSNANAYALQQAANLNTDSEGEWKIDELPKIKAALIRLINTDTAKHYVREPSDIRKARVSYEDGIPKISSGPRMIDFGIDAAGIKLRASSLLVLVSDAQKLGKTVIWA